MPPDTHLKGRGGNRGVGAGDGRRKEIGRGWGRGWRRGGGGRVMEYGGRRRGLPTERGGTLKLTKSMLYEHVTFQNFLRG